MRTTEKATLHFDLSDCPQDQPFHLVAGPKAHQALTAYADAPGKLDEHRKTNRALAMMPDDQIKRLTHFIEDAYFDDNQVSVRRIEYPSVDDHPLGEIATVFAHVPQADLFQSLTSGALSTPGHCDLTDCLNDYGVSTKSLMACSPQDQAQILLHASLVRRGPREIAKTLVFHHPEIGSVVSEVGSAVLNRFITQQPGFQELLTFIRNGGPGSADPWYEKKYSMWVPPGKTKEEIMPANTDLKFKGGGTPKWPDKDGEKAIPLYDLTDSDSSTSGGLTGAAARCVQQTLRATKNASEFNGQLWNRPIGHAEKRTTDVAPDPGHAILRERASKSDAAVAGAQKKSAFTVKNSTSGYGLNLYASELAFNAQTKHLSFPVKNWPSRYLGAYVIFFKSTGEPIKRADIPGWIDNMPEFARGGLEPSETKNYLDLISSGAAIFGVPVPFLTSRTNFDFIWPDEASTAHVLLGGLGVAQGFSDWDGDVDPLGVVPTGVICYGIGALTLVLTVFIVNPWIANQSDDFKKALKIIMAFIGAEAAIIGGANFDSSAGKWILAKLAGKVAGLIFGVLVVKILKGVFKEVILEVIAESVVEISAEEALGEIPIAGWALKIASIAADVAAMLATTIECLASPATYQLELVYTMDLAVTVKPDPTHATSSQPANWPAVFNHWEIAVKYPKTVNGQGGTTIVKSGPRPGSATAPLEISFPAIPAGGKIEIVASVYSEDNWLAGLWSSGWINAIPDGNDLLTVSGAIKERLVPLTPATQYHQKQQLAYDQQAGHHWYGTRFPIDKSNAASLDAAKVDAAIRTAFIGIGDTLGANVAVTVQTAGKQWQLVDSTNGITYEINLKVIPKTANSPASSELTVQNITLQAPTLPAVIQDCGDDGNRICSRPNITYNNLEYMLGYSWQASGQNLPRDDGSAPYNGQMYSFQAFTTLGEPQDRILEPSRGFSAETLIGFDQFGLTALFELNDKDKAGTVAKFVQELTAGGKPPADLAAEFAGFGHKLPDTAIISANTVGKDWSIGVPNVDPLFEMRLTKAVVGDSFQDVLLAFSWPVPKLDNFYLDPRKSTSSDPRVYVRGIKFGQGAGTFDYDDSKAWGVFLDANIQDISVHPSGYLIAVDYDSHKLFTLQLPSEAVDSDKAPFAMPLSGEGLLQGLMNKPVALTVSADGRILILEEGNQRVQAFDIHGNPVPSFGAGQPSFEINKNLKGDLDKMEATPALTQAFQVGIRPAKAPLFTSNDSSVPGLDGGKVDGTLVEAFIKAGIARLDSHKKPPAMSVAVSTKAAIWLVTDDSNKATYDVRLESGYLVIRRAATLDIHVLSAGKSWRVEDTTNAMAFMLSSDATKLTVQLVVSTFTLRDAGTKGVRYLDIAAESKGYIYVLYTIDQDGTPEYFLDIYNPNGSPLNPNAAQQKGVYVSKITVDQWRSMFSMNYQKLLGPGNRTEPSISQWIPSSPTPPVSRR